MTSSIDLLIEPENVQELTTQPNTILLDVSQPATYLQQHLPGAIFLDYNWIVKTDQPRMGLLPDIETLNRIFSAFGMSASTRVIAYDDEGGGRASRLLWTLAACGHEKYSLVNGGLQAWLAEKLPVSNDIRWPTPGPGNYTGRVNESVVASKAFIHAHLADDDVVILDTRSPLEYNGSKVFAQRGGHIPGAINYEWTEAMDKSRQLRLRPDSEIKETLDRLGITADKTIVTHCQSHHRSAHTFMVLKKLGFKNVKGYPGSWSDWGNDPSMPIEN